jgi:hypothetical protein
MQLLILILFCIAKLYNHTKTLCCALASCPIISFFIMLQVCLGPVTACSYVSADWDNDPLLGSCPFQYGTQLFSWHIYDINLDALMWIPLRSSFLVLFYFPHSVWPRRMLLDPANANMCSVRLDWTLILARKKRSTLG